MKKIIIAGMRSGAGKTTVTSALMRSFLSRGLNVAPFKTGPDYIDPGFHRFVTGKPSHNLDSWMLDGESVRYIFQKNSGGSDIAVIEGAMGLYDGCGTGDEGSTAHVARITGAPVILVADAGGVSRSMAAAVNGFCSFDESINITGIIFNRVSGDSHYRLLKKIIEENCSIRCFGYIPSDPEIVLESRHLGLIPVEEIQGLSDKIDRMACLVSKYVDIEGLLESLPDSHHSNDTPGFIKEVEGAGTGLKIAVAMDRAFSFYYSENISLMKHAGIEIVEFSPLRDKRLPDCIDGVYLGGGYPEVFASELSANSGMLEDIRGRCMDYMPVYAECGGLIYLSSGVIDRDGRLSPFVDFFNYRTVMTGRLQRFGYVNIDYDGISVRGHEFHHSKADGADAEALFEYKVLKESTGETWECGLKKLNVLAGYPHIHFYSSPEFFKRIIKLWKREA